ncbi:hypothetical protein BN903_152 [Halorubrum sp. AJ67]|nr:hypothetical protein BN903_152 [Halorubrum sp. AJ67]
MSLDNTRLPSGDIFIKYNDSLGEMRIRLGRGRTIGAKNSQRVSAVDSGQERGVVPVGSGREVGKETRRFRPGACRCR